MLAINGVWTADNSRCTVINVYAPNTSKDRWELWDNLELVADQLKDARLGIIGDFNSIKDPSKRSGQRRNIDPTDMNKFEDIINNSNLTEIKLSGKKFTWYRPDGTCKTKLDRILINEEWSNSWPNQILKGGKRTISDHMPIYLEIKKKSFTELVESKWSTHQVRGWAVFKLKEKLKFLKLDIKQWSRSQSGNKEANISFITDEI
ncbi:hypothetical protein ACS0TY_028771 [Phlomoides rotata]